jgi:hypothetical protein
MAEGRVPDIVGQAERFGEVLIQAQRTRDGATNLSHFQTVSEANPKMIPVGRDEHLRLVTKPSEGDGVDDAITIALERIPRPARLAVRHLIPPTPGYGRV